MPIVNNQGEASGNQKIGRGTVKYGKTKLGNRQGHDFADVETIAISDITTKYDDRFNANPIVEVYEDE